MSEMPIKARDPMGWCLALAGTFAIICAVRLQIPSDLFFDETHYIPAARELAKDGLFLNREHPPLGKQLLASGLDWFGDHPLGWRIAPYVAGILAFFSAMRAMWFASGERFATLAFGALLASGFILFVQTRIAMLDIFMAAFLALVSWQFAAALREPETARWRLAIAGAALGAAMASKWNAVPLAMLPGLVFAIARLSAGRRRLIASTRGLPVPGISLAEAFVWLGIVPLTVYALCYSALSGLENGPFQSAGLIALHANMLELQTQVLKAHPYQSTWAEWVFNLRGIWYLYEVVDGAQRGVLLIGNPLTMLLGIPALIWCGVSGALQRHWARLAMALGYSVALGLWVFAEKSVQFYYHYFLPSFFLLGALALMLDALWQSGHRRIAGGVVLASVAVFAAFYPILSAAALSGPSSFENWMLLDSWR